MKNVIKKTGLIIYYSVTFFFFFMAFFFLFLCKWIVKNFGDIDVSQILYILKSPLQGTNNSIIMNFIFLNIVPALICVCILALILWCLSILFRKQKNDSIIYTVLRFIVSILHKLVLIMSVISLSFSFEFLTSRLGVKEYVDGFKIESNIFEECYVNPKEVAFTFPKKKRNLIYIFLESMETTYYSVEDGGVQPTNLIPELHELAQNNITFTEDKEGFYTPRGATWTIGAMVAHTSGLPLKVSVDGNSYGIDNAFLPGATSLGDILNEAGYSQTLLIGSDATFGGRKSYFTSHGNYNIFDLLSAKEQGLLPEDYYVWWGYEDIKLYDYAKQELLRLSEQEQPFNLTMLTVDTHFPDGYECIYCEETYDSQYANVLHCASKQVFSFIKWIQEQEFYDDTTIIVAGDHLSMDQTFFNGIDTDYIRKGYFTIVNSAVSYQGDERAFSSFDIFPTSLASLGVQFDSNRLGLGTNLFSEEKTLIELLGLEELNKNIDMNSEYWNKYILME